MSVPDFPISVTRCRDTCIHGIPAQQPVAAERIDEHDIADVLAADQNGGLAAPVHLAVQLLGLVMSNLAGQFLDQYLDLYQDPALTILLQDKSVVRPMILVGKSMAGIRAVAHVFNTMVNV